MTAQQSPIFNGSSHTSRSNDHTKNNTNKQPAPSRQVVLAAAHTLIGRHGFAGLSMRELARESGLAKATLYHHFEDKRDVIRSVVLQDMELVQRKLAEAATGPGDVAQRLRAIIATYFALLANRGMILLQLLRESSMLESDFCEILRWYRHELIRPVMEVVQEAVDSGQARPINVEFTVTSLFGMIHSLVTYQLLNKDIPLGDEAIEHIHKFFLHGLMRQAGAPDPVTPSAGPSQPPNATSTPPTASPSATEPKTPQHVNTHVNTHDQN